MSWDRTCCMSTASSSADSGSSSTFSPSSLTRDYDAPPPPPSSASSSTSSSSFFFFSSSDYIDDQSAREREESNALLPPPPPPLPLQHYHPHSYPHVYSPLYATRATVSETCLCNSTNNSSSSSSSTQVPPFDVVAPCQSPFFYEQYLTSFKSEQSEHLPYLFDNIIYPQPCSPPSPTTDSTTYYQLDQANTATIINKFPTRSQLAALQPITYQQLSLVEPPSSNIQQKLPIVKRFYYDSNMSNTTTTTLLTTTPVVAHTNGNEQPTLPYARLDSSAFGTYDICQEKTLIGRKNNRRDVDVNMGTTTVVSRIHFEIVLFNGSEFQLKCLSKNGIFINNNYTKMSAISILPKQCTLRFPSTDLCITFSSFLNPNTSASRASPETLQHRRSSTPMETNPSSINHTLPALAHLTSQQQVILVAVNQASTRALNTDPHGHLPPLSINIPNSSSSSIGSSLSAGSSSGPIRSQHESPPAAHHPSFPGSSMAPCLTSPKHEIQENSNIISSPVIQRIPSAGVDTHPQEPEPSASKTGGKPPFSYAQLIVQAILSAPDKQMTLSQIYSFISAQYPYYEANNRGWQNSIRHNLSLNRYFIRLARKENESGKGSFWRLDQTCEEKLIDHAFRHRKQRGSSTTISPNVNSIKNESEENPSPTNQYINDASDFLLADIQASNPSTPLSPMTSPLPESVSPSDEGKRKRNDSDDDDDDIHREVTELLSSLTAAIANGVHLSASPNAKRQKI